MEPKFVAGVWNDNPGASRFGDATRSKLSIPEKIKLYKEIGL